MTLRIFAVAMLLFGAIHSAPVTAQAVGRVLMAVGEVSALRAGNAVPLTVGSTIENQDTIRVGGESNAQIRFTDESVVALRARTEFRVDNFVFSGREDALSVAFFSLVKGGIRTVTGLVGKTQRDRYRVNTPISTVGVRGTSYSLVLCQQDCMEADGSLAPDGNYGLVLDGRVAVSNAGGTVEFGVDEAFFVADATSLPQSLTGRPGFLRDRLEARQRQRERQQMAMAAMAAVKEAQRDAEMRREAAEPRVVAGTPQAPIAAADLKDESGNIAILGAGLGVGIGWSAGSEERAQVEGGRGTVITLDGQTKTFEAFKFFAGGMSGARQAALIKDAGGFAGDGGMIWGRWDTGALVALNSLSFSPPTGVHFIYGNLTPTSALPQPLSTSNALLGTFSYDYVGGPRPTDGQGSAGQFLGGTFTVNFLDRTLDGHVNYQVGTYTYNIPVPTGTRLTANSGYVGFEARATHSGSWTCSCSGTSGSIDASSIAGLFMGSRAQGLAVTFSTADIVAGRSAGAAAFKCRGARCQ